MKARRLREYIGGQVDERKEKEKGEEVCRIEGIKKRRSAKRSGKRVKRRDAGRREDESKRSVEGSVEGKWIRCWLLWRIVYHIFF